MTQFDQGAFEYLASHFQIKNMVDIGSGPGGMVYYALSRGIKAVGVDGDPSVARDCPVIIEHDYTKKPLYLGEFDLGCQWGDYWIYKFEQAGFTLDREATEGVRKHSTMWSRFTEHTGLVFNRNW